MPRFVVEKGKQFDEKRASLSAEGEELTDEDLEVSLSRAEVFDIRMFRLAEAMVLSMQSWVQTTDDNNEEAAAVAASSRKRRDDSRAYSQKEYAKGRREAKRIEAQRENRLLLSEHRSEKLMTATVDGRQMCRLLGGLVNILGKPIGNEWREI